MSDEPFNLTRAQADLARQWFDAVTDVSPDYLGPDDAALAISLHEYLGVHVPVYLHGMARPKQLFVVYNEDDDDLFTAFEIYAELLRDSMQVRLIKKGVFEVYANLEYLDTLLESYLDWEVTTLEAWKANR